jgi:uncharacterized caspase-like protein
MAAQRSALIVATSRYEDDRLSTLEGPALDAEALQGVLSNAEIGGFDVRLAVDSHVDALRRTLESFFADRARDDLLLLHFSCHGLKDDDGQLYLAAADTQIDRLLSTGIDATWVNRLMSKCRSERIVLFLDCCFAGAFTAGVARRAGTDTAGVKELFTGSGQFVIAASDAMQYSFESGRQVGEPPGPSAFTKALVDGLQTGEADRNEDGHISINELYDYLEDRIRATSPSQTPTKSAFNQVGDWVIANSTRVPSVRLLPEEVQQLLRSEEPLDRFGALIDLRDLIEGGNPRVADAATQALQKLTTDDSRRVAAAAQRLLTEEGARAAAIAAGGVVPTTPVAVTSPPIESEALETAQETSLPVDSGAPTTTTPAPADNPAALATPAHLAASHPTTTVPWSLGRAASRAAIGSIAGVVFAFAWYAVQQSNQGYPVNAEDYVPLLIRLGGWIVLITVAIVTLAESQVPALRLPDGDIYRIVGGNRFAAAAVLGVVVALTVALFEYWISERLDHLGFQGVLLFAAGFVIAEAVVGRRFRGNPKTDASAAADGSSVPWSLGRTAARTAIGSIVGIVAAFALNAAYRASQNDPVDVGDYIQVLMAVGAAVTFISVGVVTVAESEVPRLRLPSGDVYQIVGGNRFAASALLGTVVSLAIGLPVFMLNNADYSPGVTLLSAVGYVIAEAAVGRRFRASAKVDVPVS